MTVCRSVTSRRALAILAIVILVCTACLPATTAPTATPTPIPTLKSSPTPEPTRTSTPFPLASEENPLVFGTVSENSDPKILAAGVDLAAELARITNFKVISRTYPSQAALLADMQAKKVHITFLQPFTYIWARQKGFANVVLLTNHFGVYQYGSQFLANVSSKFTSYYDPAKGQNTVDAATALKQFNGKRPCWVDPTSAAGFVAPYGLLSDLGIKVKDGVLAQSFPAVVRALYVTGICDFGASFATIGDARTSTTVTQDLTDVMNRVVVIYTTEAVIPNLNLSLHTGLSKEMREDLTFALQSIGRSEKGRTAFSTAAAYEITDVKAVDDVIYDALRNLLKLAGTPYESLIGK